MALEVKGQRERGGRRPSVGFPNGMGVSREKQRHRVEPGYRICFGVRTTRGNRFPHLSFRFGHGTPRPQVALDWLFYSPSRPNLTDAPCQN